MSEAPRTYRIVLLPGDGIGPDVMRAGVAVLRMAGEREGIAWELEEHLAGQAAIDATGTALPAAVVEAAREADAVLLGAVGSPHPPPPGRPRPEETILGLRREHDAFADLRPAACLPGLEGLSPLRPDLASELDVLMVREVTAGLFYGRPRGLEEVDGARAAVDTCRYDEHQVRRVVELACDLAAGRRSG